MTTPTPADAVRAAVHGLSTLEIPPEEIAADAIRATADAILPCPALSDRSLQADHHRLLRLQFLSLCKELTVNPVPDLQLVEALVSAREESRAGAPVAAEHIQPALYSEDDLRQMWNALSDEPWSDLEPWEQLAFAQTQAIAADLWNHVVEPAPAAPALPPALTYDGGDDVQIEAANYERTSWVVRQGNWCLNSNGQWERNWLQLRDDPDFLASICWPSAEAAWAALLAYRAAEEAALTDEEIEADQAAMASQAEYEAMAMAEAEAAYWSAQGGQEG